MSIELHLHVEQFDGSGLPWRDRMVTLRGQLTLIRERAERGIPLSVAAIRRAEDLARSLESEEFAA